MQNSKQLDEQIKEALSAKAESVDTSPDLFDKIRVEINKDNMRRSSTMKIWRKVAMIAAVVCLGSATVLAATKIQDYTSFASNEPAVKNFPTEDTIKKTIGYNVKAVKSFKNGFYFDQMTNLTTVGKDKDGKVAGTYKQLDFHYIKEKLKKNQLLDLFVSKPVGAEEDYDYGVMKELNYNEIKLTYRQVMYKIVPDNYQLTKEDQEQQDAGKIMISYGSDEVENRNTQSLTWEDNGITYSFSAQECDFSENEMLEMAKAVINQK